MRRIAALATVAAGFAGFAHGAPAASADPQTSSNWSGYVASGTTFSSVSASWVATRPTCAPGRPAFSSAWVGLGGSSAQSQALEQIGTDADCDSSGNAGLSAWYELIPAPPVPIPVTIVPGDTITASVSVAGTTVSFQLADATTRQTYSTTATVASPDLSSAEWIVEAPSGCSSGRCRPLPLANFGTVTFTAASATAAGHTGTASDPAWTTTPVELHSATARYGGFRTASGGALPGSLSADGSSFAVTWQDAPAPPPRRVPPPRRWWWWPGGR